MLTSVRSLANSLLIVSLGFVAVGCGQGGSSSTNAVSNAVPAEVSTPIAPVTPAASVAAAPACTSTPQNGFYDRIFQLTNAERQKNNLSLLRLATPLIQSAQGHAQDMAAKNYFSHTGSDGSSSSDRARRAGYPGGAAENIAAGYDSPDLVFQGWMDSPGHRSNILNGSYTEIGVGYFNQAGSTYGSYWVQNFGNINSGSSPVSALPASIANCQQVASNNGTVVSNASLGNVSVNDESRIWIGGAVAFLLMTSRRLKRSQK